MKKRIRITNILQQARAYLLIEPGNKGLDPTYPYLCSCIQAAVGELKGSRFDKKAISDKIIELLFSYFKPNYTPECVIWSRISIPSFDSRQFQRSIALELLINIYKDKKITVNI